MGTEPCNVRVTGGKFKGDIPIPRIVRSRVDGSPEVVEIYPAERLQAPKEGQTGMRRDATSAKHHSTRTAVSNPLSTTAHAFTPAALTRQDTNVTVITHRSDGEIVVCVSTMGLRRGEENEVYSYELDKGLGTGFEMQYSGANKQWKFETVGDHLYFVRVKVKTPSECATRTIQVYGCVCPPSPPGPPVLVNGGGLMKTGPDAYSLDITWTQPLHDNGSPVMYYSVMVCNESLPGRYRTFPAGPTPRFRIPGLAQDTSYKVAVFATSDYGNSKGSEVTTLRTSCTPVPPKPTMAVVSPGQVCISWESSRREYGSHNSMFVLETCVLQEVDCAGSAVLPTQRAIL